MQLKVVKIQLNLLTKKKRTINNTLKPFDKGFKQLEKKSNNETALLLT